MLPLARICADRPAACLTLLSLLTLISAAQLPHLELRTDGAALHPRGEPSVERTARDRQLFEHPEQLILLLTSRPGGPDVTSAAGLRALARTHRSVASLPGIEAEGVRSAASLVDVATSSFGSLGTFLDRVPDDPAERSELLRRMRKLPWTEGLFLAPDGRAAALYAALEPGSDRQAVVRRVGRWVEGNLPPGFVLRLTGPAVAETVLGEKVLRDLSRLVPIMVLVVAGLLLLCLRTPGGLVVALGKTLVVLVATGGVMALAGIPVTLTTPILPVLLLALCVTDEVHVLARLQSRPERGPETVPSRKRELLSTLGELRRPVVYTSLSTALGFLSFLGASIRPLQHFGALAAVGILLAMAMTFTLTPALVMLLPGSWLHRRSSGPSRFRGRPAFGRRFDRRRRAGALLVGSLLVTAGLPGILRLTVQDSWIENFDPQEDLVLAEQRFNDSFWGSYRFDVVLTDGPGFFHRPEGAGWVREVAAIGAAAPHTRGVLSYLDPLDSVAELLGLSAAGPALPGGAFEAVVRVGEIHDRETDLHRFLTPDGDSARLLLLVNSADYQRSSAVAEHLHRKLDRLLEGRDVRYHTSGDIPLALGTVRAIVRNQLGSIAWTLAGVGSLLWLVNRRLRTTLVQLVPATTAAWLVLAGMGYGGLPLGVATSMFTALTLGIGVDLALHVTHAFEDARRGGLGRGDAVRTAFERTAAGRWWSTVVLSFGFLVLTASAFGPNHDLGLLLCAAMLASFLTTRLFLPHLLAP